MDSPAGGERTVALAQFEQISRHARTFVSIADVGLYPCGMAGRNPFDKTPRRGRPPKKPPKMTVGRPSNAQVAQQLEMAKITQLPDGPTDTEGLTPRQRRILELIHLAVSTRGYPPTIREIGEAAGLASPRACRTSCGSSKPRATCVAIRTARGRWRYGSRFGRHDRRSGRHRERPVADRRAGRGHRRHHRHR